MRKEVAVVEHRAIGRSRASEMFAAGAGLSIACTLCLPSVIERPHDPAASLVHSTDLVYVGAFRTPDNYQFGGRILAYWSAHNSLLIEDRGASVGEIAIPAAETATTVPGLAVATALHTPTDILGGHRLEAGDGSASLGVGIGSVLITGRNFVANVYEGYDASQAMIFSHFITDQTFSATPAVAGPYQVGTAGLPKNPTITEGGSPAGWVGEYMTPVPAEWQAALGGTALAGQCCMSIIGRTSQGPSLSAFNTSDLGHTTPALATVLVGYPSSHPALGAWSSRGTDLYTMASHVTGVVWAPGTSSILAFGTKGTAGHSCYGIGTSDAVNSWPNKHVLVPNEGDNEYCYDPTRGGIHAEFAYPYNYFVWAYDASALASVKAGSKKPWDVLPYTTWTFDLPFEDGGRLLAGVAFDPATHRLYVGQSLLDGSAPVIHVFTVSAGSAAAHDHW